MEIRRRTTVWAPKSFLIFVGSADPILKLRQVKRERAKIRERIRYFAVKVAKKKLASN